MAILCRIGGGLGGRARYPSAMLLPPRPLRLKASFAWKYGLGGAALVLVALCMVVVCAGSAYFSVRDLSEESRIWESGVTAPQASAEGRVKKRRHGRRTCTIDVRYVDANGAPHRHRIEFDMIGRTFDASKPPVVRYLPGDADRFAVSWAVDVRSGRIVGIVLTTLSAGLIGTMFAVLGIRALRRLSRARRRALDSDEVVVEITKVEPRKGRGNMGNVYHYVGKTAAGREVSGEETLARNREPLFADSAGKTMLALVDPADPGPPLVVLRDFHPFQLTEEEQAAVRSAIKAR